LADHTADTLNKKVQHLQNLKLKAPYSGKTDSLKNAVNTKLQTPAKLAQKLQHKADSLNPQHQIEQYNKKVTVLQKNLTHHIDSLTKKSDLIKIPADRNVCENYFRVQFDNLFKVGLTDEADV
jgi:exonuclease VII large subunit